MQRTIALYWKNKFKNPILAIDFVIIFTLI